MAESDLKARTRFRSSEIQLMLWLVACGLALGALAAYWTRYNADLSRIFVAGTVTLFFGTLLGGVVSLLIADFDRRRVQRAAQLEFISNVLSDLKGVYDRIDRGRTLIAAHQSAKTYGEQMREFIDARVNLLNVLRALRFDERSGAISSVHTEVEKMEAYLHRLTGEFEKEYKEISRSQSVYEALMKKALEDPTSAQQASAALPANFPWDTLLKLPELSDFLRPVHDCKEAAGSATSAYCQKFLLPLDRASESLRKALETELA